MSEYRVNFFSGLSWLLIALVLLSLAVAISYFRGEDSYSNISPITTPPLRQPREYSVFYKAGVFGPTNIRIHTGDSVRFENDSFTAVRVISDSVLKKLVLADFDSKTDILINQSFTYTFSKVGIFGYHNYNNPDENGSVIVRP